jgi:hypothetical protein
MVKKSLYNCNNCKSTLCKFYPERPNLEDTELNLAKAIHTFTSEFGCASHSSLDKKAVWMTPEEEEHRIRFDERKKVLDKLTPACDEYAPDRDKWFINTEFLKEVYDETQDYDVIKKLPLKTIERVILAVSVILNRKLLENVYDEDYEQYGMMGNENTRINQ